MSLPHVCARCWPQLAKLLKALGEGDVVAVTLDVSEENAKPLLAAGYQRARL